MLRSSRPSTANAEYSKAIGPSTGCRMCLTPSPWLRTSLSRHSALNSVLSRQSSSTRGSTSAAAPAHAASTRNAPTTNRATLSQSYWAARDARIKEVDILLALKGRGFLLQDGDVPPRGYCELH